VRHLSLGRGRRAQPQGDVPAADVEPGAGIAGRVGGAQALGLGLARRERDRDEPSFDDRPERAPAGGRRDAVEASGLGLLPNSVIDQHLLKRNRLNRLLGVVTAHPGLIGFGIDERTALEVRLRNNHLSVIGDSYVVACVPSANDRLGHVEILKRGDETSLVALRESDLAISSRHELDEYLSAAAE